jgi:predicted DNA-binding transcriptional regulator AlpA
MYRLFLERKFHKRTKLVVSEWEYSCEILGVSRRWLWRVISHGPWLDTVSDRVSHHLYLLMSIKYKTFHKRTKLVVSEWEYSCEILGVSRRWLWRVISHGPWLHYGVRSCFRPCVHITKTNMFFSNVDIVTTPRSLSFALNGGSSHFSGSPNCHRPHQLLTATTESQQFIK